MKRLDHISLAKTSHDHWLTVEQLKDYCGSAKTCVIIDRKVERLHELKSLHGMAVTAGERLKSFSGLSRICHFIVERKLEGAERVVAIGGGTVGDVVALAAHLAKRGMPLIQVPTTLLAAVDSSIGGKAAINAKNNVKNLFGAFHFADECLLIEDIWTTLTAEQRREGRVEAVKMALCLDKELSIKWYETQPDQKEMVLAGRKLKNAVCNQDPYETIGDRKILNFGHTVGHALEMLSNHNISHGFAVASGMRAALDIGVEIGLTSPETATWSESLLNKFELPGRELLQNGLHETDWAEFKGALAYDKKGFLQFIVLENPGAAKVVTVSEEIIRKLFETWRRT